MKLTLPIYDRITGEVTKTYESEGYEIFFGTLEDLVKLGEAIKNDEISDLQLMMAIKPLLKEVFTGLTDEDLSCVKPTDFVPILYRTVGFTVQELDTGTEKNTEAK